MSAVARRASWIAGAGIGAGLAAAFGLARVMNAMIVNVAPRDPLTFATVPLVLALVAAAAAVIPVRRASRVDPMQALRDE
jgi:ABC-type antimicrobial peptide transport system permease subunit